VADYSRALSPVRLAGGIRLVRGRESSTVTRSLRLVARLLVRLNAFSI